MSYRDYSAGQLNRLPPFQQQSLYLIVQEALTNAVKHSGAGQVSIQAVYSEGYLRLSLEDDGVGFEVPSQGGACRGYRAIEHGQTSGPGGASANTGEHFGGYLAQPGGPAAPIGNRSGLVRRPAVGQLAWGLGDTRVSKRTLRGLLE